MAAFFLAIFSRLDQADAVRISHTGDLVLQPFDALQCYDGLASNASAANPPAMPAPRVRIEDWHWLFKNQRWAGIGLIVIGALILLNKLARDVLYLLSKI